PTLAATTVRAAAGVKRVGATAEGGRERAGQLLRLRGPVHVEEFTAAPVLEAGGTNEGSAKAQMAYVALELGKGGYHGVVHASRELLPVLKDYIVRQGQALFTPGGHRWAFGGGYGALGTNIVGTGAVTVVRSRLVEVGAT